MASTSQGIDGRSAQLAAVCNPIGRGHGLAALAARADRIAVEPDPEPGASQ
jgi:hypothetical protein